MKISFHGAAREVTGSCHLVSTDRGRVLLDCGMFQGGKDRHVRNREPFPFDPRHLDAVVLSHAHIDHCGRLPALLKAGFSGPILATEGTCALARILLQDSGKIQEEDARWKRLRLQRRGEDADWVAPLYTAQEGRAACDHMQAVAFGAWHPLGPLGRLRFHPAGHILGAAIVELQLEDRGRTRSVVFSGDLGNEGGRLLGAPAAVPAPDILIMESTYGDREHAADADRTEAIYRVVSDTAGRGGKVVIPAFAVGRTQEILARLNDLVEAQRIDLPVFVDSPMAVEATRVVDSFPELWSEAARARRRAGDGPLQFPRLELVTEVQDSKAINATPWPAVIISASGMCTAGRVKHHLKAYIGDPRSTVLFVGYQARGTLGRAIQTGIDPVRIFGEWYRVRARVESIEGFSAHADRGELLEWLARLDPRPEKVFLVHGEAEAAATLAGLVRLRFDIHPVVPEQHDVFEEV